MPDALWRVASRTLGLSEVVRPNVRPLFSSGFALPPLPRIGADDMAGTVDGVDDDPRTAASPPRRSTNWRRPAEPQAGLPSREPMSVQPSSDERRHERSASPATSLPTTGTIPAGIAAATARATRGSPLVRRPAEADDFGVLVGRGTIRGTAPPAPFNGGTPLRALPFPDARDPVSIETSAATRATRRRDEPPRQAPPTVRVTIGRVDVRAVFAAPEPAAAPRLPQAPHLALDDYIAQRRDGRR